MKNGKCRLHGGKSTGAKTLEGRQKQIKVNRKHGFYSRDLKEELKSIEVLKQKAIDNLNALKKS